MAFSGTSTPYTFDNAKPRAKSGRCWRVNSLEHTPIALVARLRVNLKEVDEVKVTLAAVSRQENRAVISSLDLLMSDRRNLHDKSLAQECRRRSGTLAGQILTLALQYQTARLPNRKTLKQFFYFVAPEHAA